MVNDDIVSCSTRSFPGFVLIDITYNFNDCSCSGRNHFLVVAEVVFAPGAVVLENVTIVLNNEIVGKPLIS